MKKICIIFGTRPEFLKLKVIIEEFKRRHIEHQVIYIEQHKEIKEEFDVSTFQILNITESNSDRLVNIGENIISKLPEMIKDFSHIMVQGDTSTTFYSALTAFQMRKQIIHIEAGLRTYDLQKPFPEEGYRQMISRIASVHFVPHNDCATLLYNEKVSGVIKNVGNTILDLIKTYNVTCEMGNIVVITFHRRENWDEIENVLIGLRKLIKKTPEIKYLWFLHPNPELQFQIKKKINLNSVHFMNPCNHLEFIKYISKSKFIITDSGGIQEEASYLGKHCLVLRYSTERYHIEKPYLTIVKEYKDLDSFYDIIPKHQLEKCNTYGDGTSSKQIVDFLENTVF